MCARVCVCVYTEEKLNHTNKKRFKYQSKFDNQNNKQYIKNTLKYIKLPR